MKTAKKIQTQSLSNVPLKLLACIGFLYEAGNKIGRLRKFNRSRKIEFSFLTAWSISMKHAFCNKKLTLIFLFSPRDSVMVFRS